ncbi:MAG: hypothetical protein KDK23_12980, partial [Leptospiraceae bacterium]|nr:hypothetical protein [Leptospiraceae bacterium]
EKRNALILGQPTPGFGAVHQIQMFPTVSGRYLIKRLAGFLSTAEGRTLEKNPIQPEYLIQRRGLTVSLIKNPNYSGRNSLDSETANRLTTGSESKPIGPASLPESADDDPEKLLALRILSAMVR